MNKSKNFTVPFVIFRRVIYALLIRELKTRFGEYKLGLFWIFMEPLIQLGLFIFLLGYIYKRVMPNMDYTLFATSGILTWTMFKNLISRGIVSIDANRALFAFRQVKPLDAFISRVSLEFLIYTTVYLVIAIALAQLGHQIIFVKPLEFITCYICAFLIGSGLGLTIMSFSITYKDINKLVSIVLWGVYFISGVIFPIKMVPPEYRPWLAWNPMLHVMELTREAIFPGFVSSIGDLLYLGISTILIIFLGLTAYFLTRKQIFLQ